MSGKQPSKRSSRKNVQRSFEANINLDRLQYKDRVKPGKAIAKIKGLMTAAVIYGLGFGLTFTSYTRGVIDETFMAKVIFIIMIPSTVIGIFVFLITANRREFPIREDIRAHVRDFEGEDGYLWRFEPLLNGLKIKKVDIEWLIKNSKEGKLVEMAPEDICDTLIALSELLQGNSQGSGKAMQEVESNLGQEGQAAA